MQRRKTLVNSLSNSGFIEKNKITEILKQLNINENIRAEKLSIQDFANIANEIQEEKMLKRENDTEKNKNLEELNSKYNLEELFNNIVLEKEQKNLEKNKKTI